MNNSASLELDLRCSKQADLAHVAEDCFDSRLVTADFFQLGFGWFAGLDCCLSLVICFELTVDEGEQVWRLVDRQGLGPGGRDRLGRDEDGFGDCFVEAINFFIFRNDGVAEVKGFPFDLLTKIVLLLNLFGRSLDLTLEIQL